MASKPDNNYRTLEDIRQRKQELRRQIDRDAQRIDTYWNRLTQKPGNATQGDRIVSLISNGAMAIDAFLLVRKLRKNYSGLFSWFKRKEKKGSV